MDSEALVSSLLQFLGEDFLGFLPAPVADTIRMVAGFCFLFSLLAARTKPLLGEPDSLNDPAWKTRLFQVMHWVDIFALNTSTIRDKRLIKRFLAERDGAEIAETQRQIDRTPTTLSSAIDQYNMAALLQEAEANAMARLEAGAPPDEVEADRFRREMAVRRMSPAERKVEKAELVAVMGKVQGTGVRVLVALAMLSGASQACASSQLRTHAQVAHAAEEQLLAAKQVLEARMAADAHGVRARIADPTVVQREMAALQESYAPLEGAFESLRIAYNAYVEAIQNAHAAGTKVSHEAALALLSKWQAFVEAARLMGLTVPEAPAELGGIVGQS